MYLKNPILIVVNGKIQVFCFEEVTALRLMAKWKAEGREFVRHGHLIFYGFGVRCTEPSKLREAAQKHAQLLEQRRLHQEAGERLDKLLSDAVKILR